MVRNKAIRICVYGFVSMLFSNAALAQSPDNREAVDGVGEIRPLEIGDTIPEALWSLSLQVVNHPEGKEIITLNDYRDKKLIILDFWATWCAPCIRSIKDVDSLLSVYDPAKVSLLPVNRYDNEKNMNAFIEKHDWGYPSVVNNKELDRVLMSAYRDYLGMVWIKDGILFAVPEKVSVTHENILYAITGQTDKIHMANYPLQAK